MRRVLLFVVTMLAAAATWTFVAPAVAVTQPLAFNHAKHTVGLTCVGCHGGVMTSAQATLPSGDICTRCHASPPASASPASWKAIVESTAPPPWVPVTRLPAHVMFSHRRHVAIAGLACESCHGDIGTRAAPPVRAPVRLEMKTCLACHQKEGASEDCAGCHR
jgi:hypothetical protein